MAAPLKTTQGILVGFLFYATVVAYGIYQLPERFTTPQLAALEEVGRGLVALSLGPAVGVGASLYEATLWDMPLPQALLRFMLFTPSHVALSMLWSRFDARGGALAIFVHVAWNSLVSTRYWPIPLILMVFVYALLLRDIYMKEKYF
ncbi:MAG: hypothetical protein ISR58_12240 [Anaerolineales bacterium]|nr:hypothetical protein [Chloroflexota bacterium]MBL6981947.1 hypothetical protein [Anaerolineales bacterium]